MKKIKNKWFVTLFIILSALAVPFYVLGASSISSSTVEVVTLANTPSDLTLDTTNSTDTALTINYSANGNPSGTKYTVEYSSDGGNTWNIVQDKVVDDLSETITGLNGNITYDIRVSSYNQLDQTNGQYVHGSFLTKPTKPVAPTGSVSGQDITINWVNEPGTTTKLYDGADQQITINSGDTSKTFTSLTPNTAYTYYVIHSNATGDSVKSDNLTLWTDAKEPTNLRLTGRTETSLDVAIDTNGNPAGTEYQYRITHTDGSAVSGVPDSGWTTSLTHTFSGLSAGEYTVFVKARNSSSNPTAPLVETTEISLIVGTTPEAPTIDVTATETTLTVTLTPGSDPTNVEFEIILLDENGNQQDTTGWAVEGSGWAASGLTYTFENLEPNKKYKLIGQARYAD